MQQFSAPAKIILFGEHAVVYGYPALAAPVSSLRATATVIPNEPAGQGLRIFAEDWQKMFRIGPERPDDNVLIFTVRTVLEQLGVAEPDVTINLRSQIPVASGLGSGAAIAAVIARALGAAAQIPLDDDRLNSIVYEIEKVHHGTPSGIDNTVVVYEQPIYFVRSQPIERLQIAHPIQLLIGDTGRPAPTKIAVGDVRRLYESQRDRIQPAMEAIGSVVRLARQAVEQGDLARLGALMNENHALLQTLTVSSPELDRLVEAAVRAGAGGAKLSGGGRGGNMIALVDTATAASVRQALVDAGAVRVYSTTIQP